LRVCRRRDDERSAGQNAAVKSRSRHERRRFP
jgi:hypothetical protein